MIKNFVKATLAASVLATGAAHAISVIDTATYNGTTYELLSEASWTDSEAYAVSLGGHLVAVNDAGENNFLTTTWGSQNTLWIGLYRTVPGAPTFAWTNGDAVTFTNWAPGESNNCCGGERYVHTTPTANGTTWPTSPAMRFRSTAWSKFPAQCLNQSPMPSCWQVWA